MNSTTDTAPLPDQSSTARVRDSLKRRHRAEKRFRIFGVAAICMGLGFVLLLFVTISSKGYTAFQQTYIKLNVELLEEKIDKDGTREEATLKRANYAGLLKQNLRDMFPDVKGRKMKKALAGLISTSAAYNLRDAVLEDPSLIGQTIEVWVAADDDIDMLMKGHIDRDSPESERRVKDFQLQWVDQLISEDRIEKRFNRILFTAGDSREPEQAGIRGALVGSLYTLLVTLILSFPIGVAAACYLEEFAPRNRWTDLIEVNINNLAAVPSIVFGLLGLAVFINWFGLPRSAPLVGGLVLALMTLPTIIISSRAAIKSVPPSIREAALGMGASKMQTLTQHVMPLALPGMLTGTIIGMAQALGESAPLLMIGMVAFIVDIPGSPLDPATVLPVQIYLWADSPERAFTERTSAAIMVLLGVLILMNLIAVVLRKRFERRW